MLVLVVGVAAVRVVALYKVYILFDNEIAIISGTQ